MEKKLRQLFDFQKFAQNPDLQGVIDSVHSRYAVRELSMDEMDMVAAAGNTDTAPASKKHAGEKENGKL